MHGPAFRWEQGRQLESGVGSSVACYFPSPSSFILAEVWLLLR